MSFISSQNNQNQVRFSQTINHINFIYVFTNITFNQKCSVMLFDDRSLHSCFIQIIFFGVFNFPIDLFYSYAILDESYIVLLLGMRLLVFTSFVRVLYVLCYFTYTVVFIGEVEYSCYQ